MTSIRARHSVVRLARGAAAVVLAAATIAACTSTPPPAPAAPSPPASTTPPSVDERAAAPAHLAIERQWLSSWFKGTPVRIRQVDNNAITIDVPREFCFDSGQATVKPALGAVLDKTSQSLLRLPLANVSVIAAPGDAQAGASSELALKRAARVQERLRGAGVRADRLARPTAAETPAVHLRIEASSL